MPCNLTTQDASNRISTFSVSYVLNGPFGGQVVFEDEACLDYPDCGEICDPIEVTVEGTLSGKSCDGSAMTQELIDCYAETPILLRGLQRSYGRNNNTGTITVSSFFDYLNSKPISTQNFNGAILSTVLNTVFTYYTGTPAALLNLASFQDTFIKGPIKGNNTLEELQQLATAGRANLFVQVGGVLTIEGWKDHNSPVEFAIPEDFVISANPADYKYPNTTVIRARGAAISTLECGNQTVTTNENGLPGNTKKCISVGVPTPEVNLDFNNVNGSSQDILSGELESDLTEEVKNARNDIKDGAFSTTVKSQSGGFFLPNTPISTSFLMSGPINSYRNEGIYGYYFGPTYGGGFGASNANFFNFLPNILARRFPVPHSLFGLGAFGSLPFVKGNRNNDKNFSDQPSLQQSEIVAELGISDCGVAIEDISNKYVFKKEDLFDLAVRRYQESVLAQNTWNVEIPYMPCIKINQKVQFTVPQTEDCPTLVIEGIVGGINIDHESSEDGEYTSMRLAVLDTDCLGTREIRSGNLMQTLCGGDGSGINPWATSALGLDSQAQQVSGEVYLFATGGGLAVAFANYTHDCATNDEYEISFDFETLTGNQLIGAAQFTLNGGAPTALTPSGNFTTTFINASPTITLEWDLPGVVVDTYIRVFNISIRKRVFA